MANPFHEMTPHIIELPRIIANTRNQPDHRISSLRMLVSVRETNVVQHQAVVDRKGTK